MIDRRHFLLNAAALGAAGHVPPAHAREPEGGLDDGCLGRLVARSPYVLALLRRD